jgi:mono/diheme cytochrome c family protein
MRLLGTRGLVVALGVPAFVVLTAMATLADSPSPSPSGSSTASGATVLPGDPNNGATVYAQNCTVCHGASLEGGIGAVLNPIEKLPGVTDPLDPTYLIGVITNGRTDAGRVMPAWQGKLSEQQIKDAAAFIIMQNHQGAGTGPLPAGELAKRTILWVSIAIVAMGFITYLLSAYNMRWIARRAAARRK